MLEQSAYFHSTLFERMLVSDTRRSISINISGDNTTSPFGRTLISDTRPSISGDNTTSLPCLGQCLYLILVGLVLAMTIRLLLSVRENSTA